MINSYSYENVVVQYLICAELVLWIIYSALANVWFYIFFQTFFCLQKQTKICLPWRSEFFECNVLQFFFRSGAINTLTVNVFFCGYLLKFCCCTFFGLLWHIELDEFFLITSINFRFAVDFYHSKTLISWN